MDPKIELLLQMMAQPVFFVKDGIVQWHNESAKYLVGQGQTIASVLNAGARLYSIWDRKGPMQMPLSIFGRDYNGKVRVMEDGELFVLEKSDRDLYEEGSSLARVSTHMRRILQDLVSATTALQDQMTEDQSLSREAELMNRSVYRLLRLCTQISDGGNLMQNRGNSIFQSADIRAFLDKFVGEAEPLLRESGWKLEYAPCAADLDVNMDQELVERALYNLVSHGISHSPQGGTVKISAWEDRNMFCFCVSYKATSTMIGGFFAGSEDALGDPHRHEGLGTDIVRLIAELHGGSVLSSASEENQEIRTVFSIKKYGNPFKLRSPVLQPGETMSFPRGLVELSEVLDQSLYHPDKV